MKFPVLIGDIGGTNARFQLLESGEAQPRDFPHVKTADFASIETAICETILPKCSHPPRTVMLAAAGPITHNGLDLTNCHWIIRPG